MEIAMSWGAVLGGLVSAMFSEKKSASGSAEVMKPPQESKTPAAGVFKRNNQGGAVAPGGGTDAAGALLTAPQDKLSGSNTLLGK
jgi:hypothetical protein